MNNSIDCAKPVYHDTVLNTGNGSVPKDAIRNNIGENKSTNVYAVVAKKHPGYTGFAQSMLLFISILSSLYSRFLNGPMFLQNKKRIQLMKIIQL
jgi:hypothetical protein